MKDHFEVNTPEGARVSFLPAKEWNHYSAITVFVGPTAANARISILTRDVVSLCLIRRAIEHQIAAMQPGIVDPLPEGDPNEFDAIKVCYEVDRLWNEGNKGVVNG